MLGTASNNVNRGGKCGRCRHPTIFVVLPFFLSHFFFLFPFIFFLDFSSFFFFFFAFPQPGHFQTRRVSELNGRKRKKNDIYMAAEIGVVGVIVGV